MYLYGEFDNVKGERVRVEIVTHGDRNASLEIGADGSGVYFAGDPVEITSEVNDTFDALLPSSAVIRLQTRGFLGELFCESCMDAVVNIGRDGKCVFAGYVEPQSYSQSFNEVYDDLELNCIDALSALGNVKYLGIGSAGVSYEGIREGAGMRSFGDLIGEALDCVTKDLDLSGGPSGGIWYDCSRSLKAGSDPVGMFGDISIAELLFLGEGEDDVWTWQDVLGEVMRYLDLHIRQDGFSFEIFSWGTVKGTDAIGWRRIDGTGSREVTTRRTVEISAGNAGGTDTTISVGEVYNRLELTCSVTEMGNLVESPLSDEGITSPYTNRQKYLTEYVSPFEERKDDGIKGLTSAVDFLYLFTGEKTTGEAFVRDWYVQVEDHMHWKFYDGGNHVDLVDAYCADNRYQQTVPNLLSVNPGAALLSLGSVKETRDGKDNSLTAKIDMETSLVVSVNGNGIDSESGAFPNEATLVASSPLAEYAGTTSGGVFSPADDETTNYIVISGQIVLNGLNAVTCTYEDRPQTRSELLKNASSLSISPVASGSSGEGRFYCQQWWKAETPLSAPVYDAGKTWLVPYTGDGAQEYEFKYSAVGDGTDRVSKVAALACMLVIGDKCVVETGTQGQTSDFEWRRFKEREECADDDEYYGQCFTLGFDPKIGDKLLGTLYPIQNNISHEMGIDAEGTAIPVRRSDRISGKVRFMILGPVNTTWGEVTRRHKTWFRKAKWGENEIPLMAHVSSIFIKGFEMQIYSDNGLVNNTDNCDLVYMSDTTESFVNKKDDLTFRFTSALTREERMQLGITDMLNVSTPLDASTGTGLLSIYDRVSGREGKPEQLYVDAYYRECRKPRVLMSQNLEEDPGVVGAYHHYRHPALPYCDFYVTGISRNLMEGCARLDLKANDND